MILTLEIIGDDYDLANLRENKVLANKKFFTVQHELFAIFRTVYMLSSDLPLMIFFFISPQQKISSLHTGSETVSECTVFSKRITF